MKSRKYGKSVKYRRSQDKQEVYLLTTYGTCMRACMPACLPACLPACQLRGSQRERLRYLGERDRDWEIMTYSERKGEREGQRERAGQCH